MQFRSRLKGYDSEWNEVGTRREAHYPRIPPGRYTFQVEACNANNVWTATPASLAVTVQPYFWETPWFPIVTGLLVLGGLAGTVNWVARARYRRRLAQLETRHAIERERLRISQDMHDDIGSILTRVSILSDVGQSETNPAQSTQQFERIGTQVRAAVVALDEIVWATNPGDDNLPRFAEYVGRFADECFENTSVRCWQEMPTQLPRLPLRADIRHNVFLAVKEALNNVLKHSGAYRSLAAAQVDRWRSVRGGRGQRTWVRARCHPARRQWAGQHAIAPGRVWRSRPTGQRARPGHAPPVHVPRASEWLISRAPNINVGWRAFGC